MEGINFTQLEHLQAKYIGTGHADTPKKEWLETQYKDTFASIVGHNNVLKYMSIALNESSARTRLLMLAGIVDPSGKDREAGDPAYLPPSEKTPSPPSLTAPLAPSNGAGDGQGEEGMEIE